MRRRLRERQARRRRLGQGVPAHARVVQRAARAPALPALAALFPETRDAGVLRAHSVAMLKYNSSHPRTDVHTDNGILAMTLAPGARRLRRRRHLLRALAATASSRWTRPRDAPAGPVRHGGHKVKKGERYILERSCSSPTASSTCAGSTCRARSARAAMPPAPRASSSGDQGVRARARRALSLSRERDPLSSLARRARSLSRPRLPQVNPRARRAKNWGEVSWRATTTHARALATALCSRCRTRTRTSSRERAQGRGRRRRRDRGVRRRRDQRRRRGAVLQSRRRARRQGRARRGGRHVPQSHRRQADEAKARAAAAARARAAAARAATQAAFPPASVPSARGSVSRARVRARSARGGRCTTTSASRWRRRASSPRPRDRSSARPSCSLTT